MNHPTGAHAWFAVVQPIALVACVLLVLAAAVYQIWSFRRASGERRQQLKWLGYGAAVLVVCLVINAATGGGSGVVGRRHVLARPGRRAIGHGRRDPALSPLRHRSRDQPDAVLRDPDGAVGRHVRGFGGVDDGRVAVLIDCRGGGLDAGSGGSVQPPARAGAASRRPPLQPCPLRRRADGGGVRGAAARRGRPRRRAGRPARHRQVSRGADTRHRLDQAVTARRRPATTRPGSRPLDRAPRRRIRSPRTPSRRA